MNFNDKNILITGGTGSLGKTLTNRILTNELGRPKKVIIFSRDEAKQHEMRLEYKNRTFATDEIIYHNFEELVDFRIGDVRDFHSIASVLNDVDIDNGPLMVIPESHKGPVLSHTNNDVFCGAINPDDKFFDIDKAVTLTGKARSMTIHHARTLHGSAPNNSNKDRLVLFYECNSADAWPLVAVGAYLNNNGPIELCKQLEKQMVCGEVSYQPRMESVPVIIPLPPAPDHGSIFTTQKTGGATSAF